MPVSPVKTPNMVAEGAEFQARGQEEMKELMKVLKNNEKALRKIKGVFKVDIGYRWKDGKMTDEIAIRVHVRRKKPVEELDAGDIVPEELAGFPVDVIQSEIELQRTTRHDPLMGGIETRNVNMKGVGTLGAIVFDAVDFHPLALSNRHVYVDSRPGEAVGDQANQPGTFTDADAIGTIIRSNRTYDCAVVSLNGSRGISTTIMDFPGGIKGVVYPYLGMLVAKSGRTTGTTYGMIEGVGEKEFTIVPVPGHNGEISSGGDSGSVWLEEKSHAAVGLHYGGERSSLPSDKRAWAKRITRVAGALNIVLRRKATHADTSVNGPSLASKGKAILLGWIGTNDLLLHFKGSADGLTFTDRVTPGETSPAAMALTVFRDRFIVAWIGVGNRRLNVMQSDDGINWADKVMMEETSLSSPALVEFSGQLFISWRGVGNNRLNVMQSPDGNVWQYKCTLNETTNEGPALATFNNRLYLGWRGTGNNRLNIVSSSDGLTFTNKKTYADTTTSRPCLHTHGKRLYFAWQGVGNRFLNILESKNGSTFSGKITLRETCISGPVLGSLGDDLIWSWTGTGDRHSLNTLLYSL